MSAQTPHQKTVNYYAYHLAGMQQVSHIDQNSPPRKLDLSSIDQLDNYGPAPDLSTMERFLKSGRDEEPWSLFVMDDYATHKTVSWEMGETEIPELLKSTVADSSNFQMEVGKGHDARISASMSYRKA